MNLTKRRNRLPNLNPLAPFAVFLVALFPRLLSLNTFITWDEPMWVYRSIKFLTALLQGDFGETFLVGHPGVLTTICGSLGIALQCFVLGHGVAELNWLNALPSLEPSDVEAMRRLALFLGTAKLPMAVLNAICVVGIYLLAKRLLGAKAALLAALFLALDPFHLALSRVLHIDAPAANFMILSVLGLLLYLRNYSRPYLLLSAALAGLAFLSKSYSLFLVPFTGLLIVVAHLVERRRLQEAVLPLALWGTGAALTFVALWPAMWSNPMGAIRGMFDTAFGYTAAPYATSRFFLGNVVDDPGALFYPVALAFRSTPLVWLGLLAMLIYGAQGLRRANSHSAHSLWQTVASKQFSIIALIVYVCLFVALMGFAAKKFDRYMLPAIVALDILAAVGLAQWMERLNWPAIVFMLAAALIAQGAFVLPYHPYYLAYYNPLVGGSRVAPKVLPLGWGEGMDLAADYLNRKENAEELAVATGGIPGFAPLFEGRVEDLTERGLATTDYALLYISDMQQNSPVVDRFSGRQPEHVLRLRGMDYVWIFPNTEHAELASYLQSQAGPDDAVLMDALSPLSRHYPDAYQIIDGQSETEVVAELMDIAADHQRLWYVHYPESDPEGWINYELSTRALLLERTSFGSVAASCYFLPAPAAFDGAAVQGSLDLNFGGQLRLLGYQLAEDTIEYRQSLGVTLLWQAPFRPVANYAVSLRLVDWQGHSWAKEDRWLLNSAGSATSAWQAGERDEERHLLTIPPGIPPDSYELKVLVYDTDSLQNLILFDPAGSAVSTEATVATVSVNAPTISPAPEDFAIPDPLSADVAGLVELLGYGLTSNKVRPGDALPVNLFWRAVQSMDKDYSVLLALQDEEEKVWSEMTFTLPNESYPTSRWGLGEILAVHYNLLIDAAVPTGSYRLTVTLVDVESGALIEGALSIAEVSVAGREHRFVAPEPSHPVQGQIGETVALVGYDLDRTVVEPGGVLRLTLYWQPLARVEQSYSVFTHLLDGQSRIWGQRDSVPCCGICPTTSWLEGEFIADEYEIKVAADAPAGGYQIGVGMYDPKTMQRLPASDDAGMPWTDDRILLGSKIIVGQARN